METSATRQDVQSTFEQYAQLIHAAQRPLPNQSGDGAYLEKEEPSGFWADIKALGLKDVRTVRHIMEDKAAGKPQDDKLMHMEEVIQVCESPRSPIEETDVSSWSLRYLLVPAIALSLRACFWMSSGTPSSIRPCHILETNTYTDPRMARTTATSFRCWVLQTLHMQDPFLVSLHDSRCWY